MCFRRWGAGSFIKTERKDDCYQLKKVDATVEEAIVTRNVLFDNKSNDRNIVFIFFRNELKIIRT